MLKFFLLGTFRAENDGTPMPPLATLKATSLLAYLVTQTGMPQSREVLATLFWGDRLHEQARRSLNTALWQIRQMLKQSGLDPGAYFYSSGTHVEWRNDAPVWLDIAEFLDCVRDDAVKSLQRAIALYRGPFLEGIYDNWCVEERYRHEEQYLSAISHISEIYRARGEYVQALECARLILKEDPLREDAHRMAMEALYQLNQRAAALEQFAACKQVLNAELNAEPSVETKTLYDTIHADILPHRAPVAKQLPDSLPITIGSPELRAAPFAGRRNEMERVWAWWHTQSEPFAVIVGEAGVGKTRLASEFVESVHWRRAQLGWGRCYSFERVLPYQAIAEALRGLFATVPTTTRTALPLWVQTELGRLLPELHGRSDPEPPLAPSDVTNLFAAIFHALVEIARTAPLLIILDDLHWAMDSTCYLLDYLIHRLSAGTTARVRFLATMRLEEPMDEALHARLREWRLEGLLFEITLARMSLADVTAWLGEWSGLGVQAQSFAKRVYAETEGNPFFITEQVKGLFEAHALRGGPHGWEGESFSSNTALPLPLSIRELIQTRIERLPAQTIAAAQVAAVTGQEFDQHVVQVAWHKDQDATFTALDDLLRAQLIREGTSRAGRDYEFTHHKIQQVLYDSLARSKRAALHRRVGFAVEAAYGQDAANELYYHFHKAGENARAVEWGVKAGQQALELFAYRDALTYFSQAESLLAQTTVDDRVTMALYAGLAAACDEARIPERAIAASEQLLGLARRANASERETEALMRLGNSLGYVNDRRALAILQEAHALAERTHDRLLPEILYRLGVFIGWPGNWDEALPIMERAVALGKERGNAAIVARVLNGIAIAWRAKANLGRSIAAFEEGISLNQTLGSRRMTAAMLQNLGETYALLSLATVAPDYILRAHDLFVALGISFPEDFRLVGVAHQLLGDLNLARTWMQRAYELCRKQHDNDSLHETYRSYCLLLVEIRDLDSAFNLAEEFATNAEMTTLARNPDATFYRGLVRYALGQLSGAEADLMPAVARWQAGGGNVHLLWHGFAALGRVYGAQGRHAQARAEYLRALQLINTLAQTLQDRPEIRDGFLNSLPVRAIRKSLHAIG